MEGNSKHCQRKTFECFASTFCFLLQVEFHFNEYHFKHLYGHGEAIFVF